ncbi:hypothetical protein LTR56_004909 [Elasticomyces elasticus]|nr:hypothetical protein LTR56_004909 [Elasticomyces elasticus]KAK3664683.1 hypothetical protein LTR22_004551 [Elasticomyces elasticus]KAK5747733.1 hypothetical protein LTS12_022230 [Elasticomyces elasticus]
MSQRAGDDSERKTTKSQITRPFAIKSQRHKSFSMDMQSATTGAGDATVADIDRNGDVMLVCGAGSEREKRLRVSSTVLSAGSPVFKAMFSPRFEGQALQTAEPYLEVPLPEDDGEAMEIMCEVLHHRNDRVPKSADGQEHLIANVAELCDKYDCLEALKPTSRCWLNPIKETENVSGRRHLMTAAYFFHDDEAYRTYGRWLVHEATSGPGGGPSLWSPGFDDDSHPLRAVFTVLEGARNLRIRVITTFCQNYIAQRLRIQSSVHKCAVECLCSEHHKAHAMNQLLELGLWPLSQAQEFAALYAD